MSIGIPAAFVWELFQDSCSLCLGIVSDSPAVCNCKDAGLFGPGERGGCVVCCRGMVGQLLRGRVRSGSVSGAYRAMFTMDPPGCPGNRAKSEKNANRAVMATSKP